MSTVDSSIDKENSTGFEIYQIHILGILNERWYDWFDPLQICEIDQGQGITVLQGPVPDQPALHGILARIRDLNLKILSVQLVNKGDR